MTVTIDTGTWRIIYGDESRGRGGVELMHLPSGAYFRFIMENPGADLAALRDVLAAVEAAARTVNVGVRP